MLGICIRYPHSSDHVNAAIPRSTKANTKQALAESSNVTDQSDARDAIAAAARDEIDIQHGQLDVKEFGWLAGDYSGWWNVKPCQKQSKSG